MARSDRPDPLDPRSSKLWLVQQRWFRASSARCTAVRDVIELAEASRVLVLLASFTDGGKERYLVPSLAGGGHRGGRWRWALAQADCPLG